LRKGPGPIAPASLPPLAPARTYIHLPGVGARSEAHFWRIGLHYWEDFLGVTRVRGFSPERLSRLKADLEQCLARVGEPAYFAARLALVITSFM
jgi:hypothetical protein